MKESVRFVPNLRKQQLLKQFFEEGYRWRCLGCGRFYKEVPQEIYNHGLLDMCSCGSDLFQDIEEISIFDVVVDPPVSGALFFKENSFVYCKCPVGELKTGDASTECSARLELLEELKDRKVFHCTKSNLKLVISK